MSHHFRCDRKWDLTMTVMRNALIYNRLIETPFLKFLHKYFIAIFFMKFNFTFDAYRNFDFRPFFLHFKQVESRALRDNNIKLTRIGASSVHARLIFFDDTKRRVFISAQISSPLQNSRGKYFIFSSKTSKNL
jgi:hypothetical protein